MKNLVLMTIGLICGACSTMTPHVDVGAGVRDFDHGKDWESTDKQGALAIQANLRGESNFGPEAGLVISGDTSSDDHLDNRSVSYVESDIQELSLGMRYNMPLSEKFEGYVSGGMTATALQIAGDLDFPGSPVVTDRDIAYAPYLQTGVNYLFAENYSTGVMYRRTFWGVDEDVFNSEPESNSNLFMLMFGYSF